MPSDYARIERAIHFIRGAATAQPSLEDVAAVVGLSPFHFQRLFQRWAGVSPKRFLQFLTIESAKRLLRDSHGLLDASLQVGLSGPSRLHDLFLTLERMTPGEYKEKARGLTVRYGIHETPLGPALFAAVDRGLCALSFVDPGGRGEAIDELRARWPLARLESAPEDLDPFARAFRDRLAGRADAPLGLLLKGTPFQLRTWEALLRIPAGRVVSYSGLARLAGAPGAARAVGAAMGSNPIACLIPCHRVIQSTGAFGDYRWGNERKRALLAVEQARLQTAS